MARRIRSESDRGEPFEDLGIRRGIIYYWYQKREFRTIKETFRSRFCLLLFPPYPLSFFRHQSLSRSIGRRHATKHAVVVFSDLGVRYHCRSVPTPESSFSRLRTSHTRSFILTIRNNHFPCCNADRKLYFHTYFYFQFQSRCETQLSLSDPRIRYLSFSERLMFRRTRSSCICRVVNLTSVDRRFYRSSFLPLIRPDLNHNRMRREVSADNI